MHSWPLFELALHTPRLTLRLPSDAELDVLAKRSAAQVLAPEQADFMETGWTQLPSPRYERSFMQFHWRARTDWTPAAWSLQLLVFDGTEPVGGFGLSAEAFAETRTVKTGSWLLPAWRGRGLGGEARAALLALAFDGLGADTALSSAHIENAPSLGVSASLGYERIGTKTMTRPSGNEVTEVKVRLTRERWAGRERAPVTISGLDACLELFGLDG